MLIQIILATLIVSAIAAIGIFTFRHKVSSVWMILLVAFAAGTLLGGSFLELLPESIEGFEEIAHDAAPLDAQGHNSHPLGNSPAFFMLLGIILFYVIEKYIHWHHHHDVHCHKHTISTLTLIGDGIHNFIDGLLIAAAFVADTTVGITTTIAIILHEIPQELGDFAILIHSGFSKNKAIVWNLISGLFAVLGGIVGFYTLQVFDIVPHLLAITAGAFIYIALADIIPELHKEHKQRKSVTIAIGLGLVMMFLLTFVAH